MPGAQIGAVHIEGAKVAYSDSGGDLPAVLLIHGTGGSMERHFGRVLPMLTKRYRVVGVELTAPEGAERLQLDELVDQVAAVIRGVGLQEVPVSVVGYSLGAVIALALTARGDHQVERLVLINGWLKTDAQQRLRHELSRALYEREDGPEFARLALLTAYSPRYLVKRTPEEIRKLESTVIRDRLRALHMELNERIDVSELAAQVSSPTLIVVGEDDIMVPPHHGYELLGALPEARMATVSGGHALMTERPAQVYSLIESFLTGRHSGQAGAILQPERV
jgi:pimeloyl-ACP methyl ester carboxylesterase